MGFTLKDCCKQETVYDIINTMIKILAKENNIAKLLLNNIESIMILTFIIVTML